MLAALALAAPAGADLKALCVIDGRAKASTTKPTFKKYVQLFGGAGTYRFDSVVVICVDVGTGKVPGQSHTGLLEATGTFKNDVVLDDFETDTLCGWGKVTGQVTSQNLHRKFDAILGAKFAIEFGLLGGGGFSTGAFYWHASGPSAKGFPVPKLSESADKPVSKPYRYAGAIQLSDSGPNAKQFGELKQLENPDKCTKSFHVNGTVLVHEAA